MQQLEHPDIEQTFRTGYPNGYNSNAERNDIDEEEMAEICHKRLTKEKEKINGNCKTY